MFAYNRSLYINEDIVMGHEKWVIPSREAASHTHGFFPYSKGCQNYTITPLKQSI